MNVIERIILVTRENIIQSIHLPCEIIGKQKEASHCDFVMNKHDPYWEPGQSLKEALRQVEGGIIEKAVTYFGSVRKAAKNLGVDESTITRKKREGRANTTTSND